jgi:hypothetical protein
MSKEPYMPFYVNDWLSSPRVQAMTPAEELAYFRLCLFCWASGDASLPADPSLLERLARLPPGGLSDPNGDPNGVVMATLSPHPRKAGALTNEKVYFLWLERQKFTRRQAAAGKVGAAKRWAANTSDKNGRHGDPNGDPNGVAIATPMATLQPKHSSSSSRVLKDFELLTNGLNHELVLGLQRWLDYKQERGGREKYKPKGLKGLVGAVRNRAATYGAEAVVAAIDAAIANNSQGWDFPSFWAKRERRAASRLPTAEDNANWTPH